MPGFLISFAVSFVISIIIGLFVPMKKVNDALGRKLGLEPGKLGTRCFEALISDLIYTPVITLVMVFMAYKSATSHGGNPPFVPMFLKSLALSMVLGYVLVLAAYYVISHKYYGEKHVKARKDIEAYLSVLHALDHSEEGTRQEEP